MSEQKEREEWLEGQRCRITQELIQSITENKLLQPGEEILFEISIEARPIVTSRVLDKGSLKLDMLSRNALLPKDRESRWAHDKVGTKSSYSLRKLDWERILDTSLNDNQRKIINWLSENNNGPIHLDEALDLAEIHLKSRREVGDLNKRLNEAGNYKSGKEGVYYKFTKVHPELDFHAIQMYGYFS